MSVLTEDLLAEGDWFAALLDKYGDHPDSVQKFRKGLAARSSILHSYAKAAWDNNVSPCPLEMTREEKYRAGEYLVALREIKGKPGPKPRGVEGAPLQVPLTPEENDRLNRYCEQNGVSRAAAARIGMERLPGWSDPLK